MSVYVIGICAMLLGTTFHAGANILDNYFSDKVFDRLANLIFFSMLVNLLFLPIIYIIDKPGFVSLYSLGIIFLISVINIFYQFPYYNALRDAETSVVSSLFSLGKIVTPLLAFVLVKEQLSPIKYAGFFIIIIASVFLTLDFKEFHFKKAFFLMLLVSIILTIQSILFKYLYETGMSWGTSVTWTTILDFLISLALIFTPKNYSDFKISIKRIKSFAGLLLFNQFLTWGGEALGLYALYFIPVSVFEGISSTQPIFVLIIALLFTSKKSDFFKEFTDKKNLIKKIVLFVLMTIGTIMVI